MEAPGRPGIAGREAFDPRPDLIHHHLYVVVEGNQAHRDHLDLRDHLRVHADDARRYAELKHRLACLLAVDRDGYVEGKAALIQELLGRARGTAPTTSAEN